MTSSPAARVPPSPRSALRLGASLAAALLGALMVVAACTGSEGGAASPEIKGPACPPAPCQPGAQPCFQPSSDCSGEWYCWSDMAWHCAPPDSGPPADVSTTVEEDAEAAGEDAADSAEDAPVVQDAPAEVQTTADAAADAQVQADVALDAVPPTDG